MDSCYLRISSPQTKKKNKTKPKAVATPTKTLNPPTQTNKQTNKTAPLHLPFSTKKEKSIVI